MNKEESTILFMGAGGCGISNILQFYFQKGYKVIGHDRIRNVATRNLEKKGIKMLYENEDKNVLEGITDIIRSSAVKDDNELIIEARQKNINVYSRHDIYKQFSKDFDLICIAGSSGKTSTTGITAHILKDSIDCSYIIGIHGNGGKAGTHKDFVIEADEYAKTFLSFDKIKIGLITGVGYDHVDIYPTQDDYDQAFIEFATKASKNNLIINGDNPKLVELTQNLPNTTSYGFGEENDFRAINVKNYEGGSAFDILYKKKIISKIKLNVIGGHNVHNALAGFVVNYINNIEIENIEKSLESFSGMPRRLQILKKDPYFVYDDYAHLPGEIETVLKGVRDSFKDRRILCYFQPHTFTRINKFFDGYIKALGNCDYLFLGDVYASRDKSGSVDLQKLIEQCNATDKTLSGNIKESQDLIETIIKEGDVLICLNAGDGTKIAHYFASL